MRCVGLSDQDCDRFSKYACPNCTKKGKKSTVSKKKKKKPPAAAAAAMPALPGPPSPASGGGAAPYSASAAAAQQKAHDAPGGGAAGGGAGYAGAEGVPPNAEPEGSASAGLSSSMPPVPLAGEGGRREKGLRELLFCMVWCGVTDRDGGIVPYMG